jgi:hypothetical protein
MPIWAAIAMLVVSYIVTAAMMPKAPKPPVEAFEDFDFPQTDDGTPQAVIFGDCWSADWTVIGVGNYRTTEIRKST